MHKRYTIFFSFVMPILFITVFTARTVRAANHPVLVSTNTATVDVAAQWEDSLCYFSFPKKWNPDTYQYENVTKSNTKTLTVSCKGEFQSPLLVTLTFLSQKDSHFKPVFLQPEGVLFYNVSGNQMMFCVLSEGDYDVSLWLTGEGSDQLNADQTSIGQIIVTAKPQPAINQPKVMKQEKPEEETKEESKDFVKNQEEKEGLKEGLEEGTENQEEKEESEESIKSQEEKEKPEESTESQEEKEASEESVENLEEEETSEESVENLEEEETSEESVENLEEEEASEESIENREEKKESEESIEDQEKKEASEENAEWVIHLPDAVNGYYYERKIAIEEKKPETGKIIKSALPKGMVLKDGVIAGIPEDADGIYVIEGIAGNQKKRKIKYSIKLSTQEDRFVEDRIPDAVEGEEYSADLFADSMETRWRMIGGALPKGLSLGADGTLLGIPEKTGVFVFELLEKNGVAGDQIVTQTITIYENETLEKKQGGTLPDAVLGNPYKYLFQSGIKKRIYWMVAEGSSLPTGLTFAEGKMTGIPEKAGEYSINILADIGKKQIIIKKIKFVVEEKIQK